MSMCPAITRFPPSALRPGCSPMDRRGALARLGAAGLSLALGGCEAPPARLRVGSIVFPGYELMFLARELGLLDERQVRLVELYSNTDTMRALAAGQLEAAGLTLDEMLSMRADGVDLRVIAVLDLSAGADVVLARAPVTLATLAGKRIGAEDGATGAIMLNALLTTAGLTLDKVHKVPITLDRSEEFFNNGRIDVVVTAEPWAARLEKGGAQRIFDSAAIAGRVVDVLVARSDALGPNATALKRLVEAHFLALAHLQAQSADASRRMAPRLQVPAPDVMKAFRGLQLPDAAMNREILRAGGQFDRTSADLQRVMKDAGLLRDTVGLGGLVDTGFLPS